MKQTYDTLRTWYLKDLEEPDVHHGRTTPKARHIEHWTAIESMVNEFQEVSEGFTARSGNTWVWSDIHFGHKNIMQYAGRPFDTWQDMNAAMIAAAQRIVKPEDTLIFGGDIGFMSVNAINEILHLLPGYKIQIVGNHDIDRKGELMKLHMDERHLCMVRDIPDTKYQLLFTHYPLDRVPPNCVNVHGHIHQNLANAHNINICVEHTNYEPMNIKLVEQRAIAYLEQ